MQTVKINNIAELRTRKGSEGAIVEVLGYYNSGDGGGGQFYWNNSSIIVDNSGIIIQVTGVTTGRWIRKYDNLVNVKWFGAKGDNLTDDTTIIQNVLNLYANVIIPYGDYRIDGTLYLNTPLQKLLINGNLYKKSTFTNNTSPLINIKAQKVSVVGIGNNIISCENNSPFGIILIGTENITNSSIQNNILWSNVSNLNIIGNNNDLSVGVDFNSIEAFGSAQANYANTINNLLIQNVGTGIRLNSECNGNIITNNHFYNIKNYVILLDGTTYGTNKYVSDNSISGMFVHFSLSLLYIIKGQRAVYNNFIDLHGEPGSGGLFNLDINSFTNTIIGTDNTPDISVEFENKNFSFTNGRSKVKSLEVLAGNVDILTGGETNSSVKFKYNNDGDLPIILSLSKKSSFGLPLFGQNLEGGLTGDNYKNTVNNSDGYAGIEFGTNGGMSFYSDDITSASEFSTPKKSFEISPKGVELKKVTTTEKNAISTPPNGLLLYDTTLNKLCVYENNAWRIVTTS